jgi:hypothetical protein
VRIAAACYSIDALPFRRNHFSRAALCLSEQADLDYQQFSIVRIRDLPGNGSHSWQSPLFGRFKSKPMFQFTENYVFENFHEFRRRLQTLNSNK